MRAVSSPGQAATGYAGHTCPSCGGVVTWVDHLPPLHPGGPVRCYAPRIPAPQVDRDSPWYLNLVADQEEARGLK